MSNPRWTDHERAEVKCLYAAGTWVDLRAALPGRTRVAIQMQARALGVVRLPAWAEWEKAILRAKYRSASRADLLAALPGHSWGSISMKAVDMRLRRERKHRQSRDPIIRALRTARRGKTVSLKGLGKRVGSDGRTLNDYEAGRRVPRFRTFLNWVEALGFELTLRPIDGAHPVRAGE